MRFTGLFLLVVLLIACAPNQSTIHLLGKGSWAAEPVAPEMMEQRVESAALEYQDHAPVPRIALFDIVFPASEEEFKSTGGYGVLLLTALSQEHNEIPPKRLYVTLSGTDYVLQEIHSNNRQTPKGSRAAMVLGANRWDGLYLFPVHLMNYGAVLKLDFATNRDGFVLGHFSTAERDGLGYSLPQTNSSAEDPSAREAVMNLVAREYPGFVVRAP